MRILVVEEDAVAAAFLSEALAGAGREVAVCRSPIDAALAVAPASDRAGARPPVDLVVLEAPADAAAGLTALRELLRRAPDLRILVLASLASPADAAAYLAAGAADVVLRAVDSLASLRQRVARLLAGETASVPPAALAASALPARVHEGMARLRRHLDAAR